MGGGANANVTFAGNAPNTYTGTTTVNGGTLYLSKTPGAASIGGPLVIGDGSGSDTVNPTTAGQFANQPPVTINTSGALSLSGGANQSIGALTMTGGTVTTSSGVLTLNGPLSMTAVGSGNSTINISNWNGQFVLGGDVTAVSAAAGSGYVRVFGSGNLGLGGADRTFTVDAGTDTTAASDMAIQVPILDAGAPASLTKTGSGTLRLEGYSSYTGGTKVLAGVLVIRNNSYVTFDGALGTGPLTLGNATLAGDPAGWSPYTIENPLTLAGDAAFGQTSVNTSGFSFTGGAGLTGTRQLTVNVPVSISGGMTGGASGFGFTKGGSAGLTVYAAAGTNVGSIVIAGGTLEAIGNGALAGTGTITVNGGTTFRSRGTANYDKTYGDHSILVRSGGTLSITSTSYTGPQIWSGLSFESGAVVDVGSVGNTTQVFDTSLVALPSAGVMTFTGMGTDELKVAGNWPQLTGDLEIAASGTRPVRLYGTFTEAGAGRKLTKSGGGEFYYSTPFAPGHSGGTEITGGSLVWQYSGGPGTLSFGAAGGSPTAIRLSSGGGFSLDTAAMTSAGEFSVDNPIVVHGSGQLGFATSEGRFPRTTGDLMLQGQLTASFDTGYAPASHYVVANTIRIDQSGPGPRSIVIRSSYSHVQLPISISGPIIDDGAAVLNGLIIDNSDSYVPLNITGAGNTYAGGTTIAGSPFGAPLVSVQPGSSLGTGNVEVGSGAQLQLTEPANLAPGAAVNLVSDAQALAVLGLAYDGPPTMLSPNSSGVLALDVPVYTHTIDMASLGDGAMRLGSTGNGEYQSGTLGASGGKYRLGGCDGTLTLSAANVLTGPNAVEVGSELVNGWGTVALTAANDYSGGTTVNTALVLGASGAMGSGPVTVADGAELDFLSRAQAHGNDITFQRAGWLWVPQPGTDVSLDGKVDLAGDQGALLVETESVISLTGTLALGNSYLDVYGSGVLALNTISTTGDGDVWVDIGAGLAFTTPSALPAGHLYSHGGVFVLDGLSWASFTSARSYGPGPNQWEFSSARGGGFAARSTPLVIDSTPAGFSWDRDFTLGSDVRTGTGASASYYADQPVILAQNVVLSSEQRTITVAGNGPGLTGRAGTGAAHVLSGNLTGPGSLTWNANTDTAELVLAGTNNAWTGASYVAAVDYDFSAGLGGLVNARGNGFVRFDGNASLPKGNAGNPAYLAAIGSVFAGTAPAEFGYLLTARPGGAAYNLPSGYRFLFGGVQYTDAQPGTLGSTSADGNAGSATLRKSDVLVTADPSYLLGSSELHLLVRDGTLVLGTTPPGAADGPVRFVPVLAQYESSWRDENSPATPVSDNPAAFQLVKRGVGTLVLQDVRYTNLAGAADTSGQFTWTLGTGVAEGFGGAVRETGAAAGDSLSGNPGLKIKMRGGVVELGGGDFTLLPGTGPHEVDMSEGGGFAAHGATRTVNLGGLEPDPATMVWNADSVGSFVNSDAPLVFGSLTANDKVLFVNPIELNGGMRSIASVHGEEPEAAAELSGDISGGTGAGLVFGALNAPWGEPLPAGTIVLSGTNTYLGGTVVNAGTLVAGNVNALPGGGAITVAAGATAALAIDMNLGAGHAAAVRSAAVQPVPEPATLVLLLAGVVCVLAWIGRRRARSCSAA
jgi:autotransporter-associated beta strand protein